MHYYKRNIGDYHKKAGRLSMLEHGAYTLLIDACYDRERFPTKDEAIDWCWARSADEVAAVEFVLSKVFKFVDGLYVQDRIMEEVGAYHQKANKNQQIAIERESKRRAARSTIEHETCTTEHDSPPNQEPRTNNQEPITKHSLVAQVADAPSPVGTLPTNKGEMFPVYPADIQVWAEAYPAVDIIAELKKIKAWLTSNPERRKTARGMKSFINKWLAKEQDTGRRPIPPTDGGFIARHTDTGWAQGFLEHDSPQ